MDEEDAKNKNSRRNFLKLALATSILFMMAGISSVLRAIANPAPPPMYGTTKTQQKTFPRVRIRNISELEINKPIIFNYPLDNEPNILVKLGTKAQGGVGPEGDIVAFSQICQHLGCYYNFYPPGSSPSCNQSYRTEKPVGYCCCHGGTYDFIEGGKVIGGPPPRPVPQVKLEVDDKGDIYAVGMGPPTIFGHNTGSEDVSYDLLGGNPVG
jgi:arsenite oxidase small subunit